VPASIKDTRMANSAELAMNKPVCTAIRRVLALLALGSCGLLGTAQAETYLSYRCENGARFEVTLFPETKAAYIQLDGKSLMLPKFVSITGARYRKGGVTFWFRGERATLRRAGVRTECKQQQ
jgi:membrane-bound inhibitor of C-type lysozyme